MVERWIFCNDLLEQVVFVGRQSYKAVSVSDTRICRIRHVGADTHMTKTPSGAVFHDHDFRRRMRAALDKQGLTQSQLAAKIWGVTVDSKGARVAKGKDRISEWLSGKARPNAENCEKLARALGLKASDLMIVSQHGGRGGAETLRFSAIESDAHPGMTLLHIHRLVPTTLAARIHLMLAEVDDASQKASDGKAASL
jgi:transcriptional regulator with XRE-family HTH domain